MGDTLRFNFVYLIGHFIIEYPISIICLRLKCHVTVVNIIYKHRDFSFVPWEKILLLVFNSIQQFWLFYPSLNLLRHIPATWRLWNIKFWVDIITVLWLCYNSRENLSMSMLSYCNCY